MNPKLLLLFPLLILLSVNTLSATPKEKPIKLRGTWVRDSSNSGHVYFHKAEAFEQGNAGMCFKGGGRMDLHRTPSNCGVDAQYVTVPGTWVKTNDRKFTIAYRDVQGNVEEDLEVHSLTGSVLVVAYLARRVDNAMKVVEPKRK